MSSGNENVRAILSSLKSSIDHLSSMVCPRNVEGKPGMVQIFEDLLREMFSAAWRLLLEYEARYDKVNYRNWIIDSYLGGMARVEALKKKSQSATAKVSTSENIRKKTIPSNSAGDELHCAKSLAKPMNAFYKKRMAFFAQFRYIVNVELCPNLSKSECIRRLIEEFETAIAAARTVTTEAGSSSNKTAILPDELLVSLAMSKLDNDTLAQVTDRKDPTTIPTWEDFREKLLHLTTDIDTAE